jgi:hypothetical protein
VPLKLLAVDRDRLFRPCPELREAAGDWPTLDRPLVPLLNQFWRLGLPTCSSCGGHPGTAEPLWVSLIGASARALTALRISMAYLPDPRLVINLDIEEGEPEIAAVLYWMWPPPQPRRLTRDLLARCDLRVLACAQALERRRSELPDSGLASWECGFVSALASIRDFSVADLPPGWRARPLRKTDRENLRTHFGVGIAPDGPDIRLGMSAGVFEEHRTSTGSRITPLWSWSVSGTCLGCVTDEVRRTMLPRGCEPFQPAPHVERCRAKVINA